MKSIIQFNEYSFTSFRGSVTFIDGVPFDDIKVDDAKIINWSYTTFYELQLNCFNSFSDNQQRIPIGGEFEINKEKFLFTGKKIVSQKSVSQSDLNEIKERNAFNESIKKNFVFPFPTAIKF